MAGLNFKAPPVCASFMRSDAYGRLLAGPVGSGKTVSCVVELLRRSINQSKGSDGYRYTRFAVVRQTLKQLKDTVLRDCQQWLGPVGGLWKVSDGTFYVAFDDVRSEWPFIPLENAEDQARLLSMQLTGAWMSECIEMDLDVLGPLSGRIGRYPSADKGTPTWAGWIADTNFPQEMSPWHTYMENPPLGVQVFKQPSGLSTEAENLNHLAQTEASVKLPLDHPARLAQGRRYYERMVEQFGEDSDFVNRYVKAQYGDDPSGAAVFKNTFRPDFHIVDDTMLIPGYPILIGQDFGRNPWSLIAQMDHLGRLVVHEEVPGTNIGLEKHVVQNLRPVLFSNKYLGSRVCVVGDPSGIAKGNVSEESCFEALGRLGLPAFPAPTNDIEPRLRAVEALLGRQTNGGPTLMISRRGAPFLCRAMSGGYRFTKFSTGALRTVPEKNDKEGFSHVADDLQYLALVVHGGVVPEISRRLRPRTKKRTAVSAQGWT
jgi:hypothetical protein